MQSWLLLPDDQRSLLRLFVFFFLPLPFPTSSAMVAWPLNLTGLPVAVAQISCQWYFPSVPSTSADFALTPLGAPIGGALPPLLPAKRLERSATSLSMNATPTTNPSMKKNLKQPRRKAPLLCSRPSPFCSPSPPFRTSRISSGNSGVTRLSRAVPKLAFEDVYSTF